MFCALARAAKLKTAEVLLQSALMAASKEDPWDLVREASEWFAQGETTSLCDVFKLVAKALLVRASLRDTYIVEYDPSWSSPPSFGLYCVQLGPGMASFTSYSTQYALLRRAVTDNSHSDSSHSDNSHSDGDTVTDSHSHGDDSPTGAVSWVATSGLGSFELWSEPLAKDTSLEELIGRARQLSATLAPLHFAVQPTIG